MITFKPTLSYTDRLWAFIQIAKVNPDWSNSDTLLEEVSSNLSLDKESALKELDDHLWEISNIISRHASEKDLSVTDYVKTWPQTSRVIMKYAFKVSNNE